MSKLLYSYFGIRHWTLSVGYFQRSVRAFIPVFNFQRHVKKNVEHSTLNVECRIGELLLRHSSLDIECWIFSEIRPGIYSGFQLSTTRQKMSNIQHSMSNVEIGLLLLRHSALDVECWIFSGDRSAEFIRFSTFNDTSKRMSNIQHSMSNVEIGDSHFDIRHWTLSVGYFQRLVRALNPGFSFQRHVKKNVEHSTLNVECPNW